MYNLPSGYITSLSSQMWVSQSLQWHMSKFFARLLSLYRACVNFDRVNYVSQIIKNSQNLIIHWIIMRLEGKMYNILPSNTTVSKKWINVKYKFEKLFIGFFYSRHFITYIRIKFTVAVARAPDVPAWMFAFLSSMLRHFVFRNVGVRYRQGKDVLLGKSRET